MKPVKWIEYREGTLKYSAAQIKDILEYIPLTQFEDDYTKMDIVQLILLLDLLSKYFGFKKNDIFYEELKHVINKVETKLSAPDELVEINESKFILSRNGLVWRLLNPTKVEKSGNFETIAYISNLGLGVKEQSIKLAFEIIPKYRGKKVMKKLLQLYLIENKSDELVFEAMILADNEASIGLVQSLGFQLFSQQKGNLCFRY